jgi:hypothetical protein
MNFEDEQLKQLLRSDKGPEPSTLFLESTLEKAGFHSKRLTLAQPVLSGSKLSLRPPVFSQRSYGVLLLLAIAGILLVTSAIHTEEEELHRIDTLSLSTLLVL